MMVYIQTGCPGRTVSGGENGWGLVLTNVHGVIHTTERLSKSISSSLWVLNLVVMRSAENDRCGILGTASLLRVTSFLGFL